MRAPAVLVVDRTAITQPATTVDDQRFAGALGQQLVGDTIVGILQDREIRPGFAGITGKIFDRFARIGIDGQEVDLAGLV